MSVKFGKLMQQADKNYKKVAGKIETIDTNAKKSQNTGPSQHAIRAFLEQKEQEKRQELEKKLEDRKRLVANKAVEDRKQLTKYSLLRSVFKSEQKASSPAANDSASKTAKNERALEIAKEKIKDGLDQNNDVRKPTAVVSNVKNSQEKSSGHKSKQKVAEKPKLRQPVNFLELMQQAAKNKTTAAAIDSIKRRPSEESDQSESEESEEERQEIVVKPKNSRPMEPPSKKMRSDGRHFPRKEPVDKKPTKPAHGKLPTPLPAPMRPLIRPEPTNPSGGVQKAVKLAIDKSKMSDSKIVSKNDPRKPISTERLLNQPTTQPKPSFTKLEKKVESEAPTFGKKRRKEKPVYQAKPIGSSFAAMKGRILKQEAPKMMQSSIKRPGTPPVVTSVKKKAMAPVSRNYSTALLPSTSGQTFAKKSDQMRAMIQRREMLFKQAEKRPVAGTSLHHDEEDEDDEFDSELDDFIDDTEYDDPVSGQLASQEIRRMFKYDPRKYEHLDDGDDRRMEASYTDIEKEEIRSARLGLLEDLEDIQREHDAKRRFKKTR